MKVPRFSTAIGSNLSAEDRVEYFSVFFLVAAIHILFMLYFYRAMLCIRGTSHGPVSVSPSQVGVLLKRLNESSWFLACEAVSFLPPVLHCVKRNSVISKNKVKFPLELCPKVRTSKVSPRHIDRRNGAARNFRVNPISGGGVVVPLPPGCATDFVARVN